MEAKWARLAAAGVVVLGISSCKVLEDPKVGKGRNSAAAVVSDSMAIVDTSQLFPTDCRGDLPLKRIMWEQYNMGKPEGQRKPVEAFNDPVSRGAANQARDAFNKASCGEDAYAATNPQIQNDTVNPCNNGEITIKEANKRLKDANVTNFYNRKGLANAYRQNFCPQATATPDRR